MVRLFRLQHLCDAHDIEYNAVREAAALDVVHLEAGVARRASAGPVRHLVLFSALGLPPAISPVVDRTPVPVYAGGSQVGRVTSLGWSPILK